MQPQKKKKGIINRIYNTFYPLRLVVRTALLLLIFFVILVLVQYTTHSWDNATIAFLIGTFLMGSVTVHHTYHKMGWEGKGKVTDNQNELVNQSPYEFEHTVANLLQNMGYTAKVTSKSDGDEGGDYGADIIAKKDGRTIVVQVKKWASYNLVGAPDVRSVLGSLHTFKASKAILVTTSDFTEYAYEQAKGAPIELWNGAYLCKLMAKYA